MVKYDDLRHDERLAERNPQAVIVIGAVTLGGDTGRAHAEKIHAGVKEAEDGAANGDGSKVDGAFEMTDDAGVHHAEQRYGNVRQDHRGRDTPHVAVAWQIGRAHGVTLRTEYRGADTAPKAATPGRS
jgi:hypothetical protein